MLYTSQRWDFYYCYRCRRWFKRYYDDRRVFLPVKDAAEIRYLTWFHFTHLQSVYDRKKFRERIERGPFVWSTDSLQARDQGPECAL